MIEIDKSKAAIAACEFWQRIGAALEGRPVGTIHGAPIYEVDELPPEGCRLFVPPAHYAKGEAWVRRAYRVAADTEIVEIKPLPVNGPGTKSWTRG
ncbi:hypothetical protein ACIGFJ_12760 [Brevundimonas diminuta]|uniref:hypothetical protein n=1 Tax=Brevundimonas diminuta TaxID=293 RepID=UPI0037CC1EB6